MKKKLSPRFLMGLRSALGILCMLALLIFINVGVSHLPSRYTQWDLTGDDLYTLSQETKQIVSALDKDVTLTLLAPKDSENEIIKRLLDRYRELNPMIHVAYVDPSKDAQFLMQYEIDLATLYTNSVLVEAENRHQLVGYDRLYTTLTQTDENGETVETAQFLGESALTNAIRSVVNAHTSKIYLLSGHGEKSLSQQLALLLEQDHFVCESLSLMPLEQVPQDADIVLIHVPANDIAQHEKTMLCNYLDAGGRIALVTDYADKGLRPNLDALCAHMGMQLAKGLVVEGDSGRHMSGYAYRILPQLSTHQITSPLRQNGYYVLLTIAQAIEKTEGSRAALMALLSTSDKAYLKADGLNTTSLDREEGDASGAFSVGVLSILEDGQMLWVPSSQLLDDYVNQTVSGGNFDFFMNALGFLCGQEEMLTIRTKPISQEVLSVPARVQGMVTVTLIVTLPLFIIALGALVVIRRKRR